MKLSINEKIKTFNDTTASYQKVEVWSTRNGVSVRNVKRVGGKFVNNISAKQLTKIG
jgi:hypothetical protein